MTPPRTEIHRSIGGGGRVSTNMTRSRSSHHAWVLILTSIGSLMVALDVTVVATALGANHQHLHASLSDLEWSVNAYGLSFGVLLISGSPLGQRVGRRRLYAVGLALFAAASA